MDRHPRGHEKRTGLPDGERPAAGVCASSGCIGCAASALLPGAPPVSRRGVSHAPCTELRRPKSVRTESEAWKAGLPWHGRLRWQVRTAGNGHQGECRRSRAK